MPTINNLNAEEIKAVRAFANAYAHIGVRWKGLLRNAWSTGVYSAAVDADTKATLQSIRNKHGTSWLSQFKLTEKRS